ncbi:MAG: outer membrane protein assembly factor [Candidatus Omnitrophica bacterium]|nr:outer membrane protein assembly factor [Candidatus Omnitrophota bacterium]
MKKSSFLFCLCGCLLTATVPARAENQDPDRYTPLYASPLSPRPLKGFVSRAIEWPFKALKWPLDQSLVYTEKHRLDKKAFRIYERLIEFGVKPRLDSLDFTGAPSYGAEFDLVRIAKQKENYPDLIVKSWIHHGPTTFFQAGGEIGARRIAETGLHTATLVQYENRRHETFYGIGPHTSRGDSTSFIQEKTTVGAKAGYEFSSLLDLTTQVSYNHANIKNRAHEGKGDITQIFAGENIPGLHGDHFVNASIALTRDTRDSKEDASQGSYQKLLLKFTEGVSSSKARYLTYRVDAAKYLQLASPLRVLAARFWGEFNQRVNGGDVPFYEMTKLGSSGLFPYQSQTSRGYVYNRFYGESAILLNLEYRYTVWQYKAFKMKAVAFFDEGQVSKDFATFRLKDFRESYGGGLRLSYSKVSLFSFSVAHGREGTQFYLENKLAF